MHPDLIRSHADHHLEHLRRPRLTTGTSGPLAVVRTTIARALRAQALRLESPLPAGTASSR